MVAAVEAGAETAGGAVDVAEAAVDVAKLKPPKADAEAAALLPAHPSLVLPSSFLSNCSDMGQVNKRTDYVCSGHDHGTHQSGMEPGSMQRKLDIVIWLSSAPARLKLGVEAAAELAGIEVARPKVLLGAEVLHGASS